MMYSLVSLVNVETTWAFKEVLNKTERTRLGKKYKKKASAGEICEKEAKPMSSILQMIMDL